MLSVRQAESHAAAEQETEAERERARVAGYQPDPNRYASEVLKVHWWAKQQEIARAVVNYARVFVQASHNVGKTHFVGGLINWWVDCFNPSVCKTTAPNKQQVKQLTWGEVRAQRHGRNMPPTSPKIQFNLSDGQLDAKHWAEGYTARDAASFQGTHSERLLVVFEEAVGIAEQFWEAADGMTSSGSGNKWLAVTNPTDTSSFAFNQFLSGEWHVITISALEHPNILAELEGLPRPYPAAISKEWVDGKFRTWCRKLEPGDKPRPGFDVAWPPLEHCERKGIDPTWYRPDARFEGRVLGRWPSSAPDAIWSDALFQLACKRKPELHAKSLNQPVELGCDVARFGDDDTAIHARQGAVSLHHERANGWSTTETANRLKQLCKMFAPIGHQNYWDVHVKIDDTGVGGGVVDQRGEYAFIGINAGSKPLDAEGYKYKRDELWFTTQERALEAELDLSMLGQETLDRLRREVLGVKWKPNARGQREVEQKAITKKRIKISPDNVDAMNLAYYSVAATESALLGGDRDKLLTAGAGRRRRDR